MKLESVLSINTRSGEQIKKILPFICKLHVSCGTSLCLLSLHRLVLHTIFGKVYVYSVPSEGYLHSQFCKSMYFYFLRWLNGVSVIVSPINHLHIFIMQYKCPWVSVRTDESAFPWMHFENDPEISLILMKAFHAKVCLTELYSLTMHLKRFHFSPSDNWHKIYRIKQDICFDQSLFKCLSCLHISFT